MFTADSVLEPNLGHVLVNPEPNTVKMRVSDNKKHFKKDSAQDLKLLPPSWEISHENFCFSFFVVYFGRHGSGSGSATPEQDMKMY
jgi:hypothetical protein